jgi:hypothetical protein
MRMERFSAFFRRVTYIAILQAHKSDAKHNCLRKQQR